MLSFLGFGSGGLTAQKALNKCLGFVLKDGACCVIADMVSGREGSDKPKHGGAYAAASGGV
jgi:hypothetical protein